MKGFIAFMLVVVMPVGGLEAYNNLEWGQMNSVCRSHYFKGAQPALMGLRFGKWQCWTNKGDESFLVDVEEAYKWELEALNLKEGNSDVQGE
jgi:hypothetical protein